jgi:hypothetical protein
MEEFQKAELHQQAVAAMEACAESYGAVFEISYRKKNKGYRSAYDGQWKIKVYAQIFCDESFMHAVAKAVKFVYDLHNSPPL